MESLLIATIMILLVAFISNQNKNKKDKDKEKMGVLVDNLPNIAVCLINKNNTILYSGGEEVKKAGYDKHSAVGKNFYDNFDEGAEQLRGLIKKAFKFNEKSELYNDFVLNGVETHYRHQIIPITNNQGQAHLCLILSQNINDLVDKDKNLKGKNKLLLEIVWLISHKISGPIARIKGLMSLIDGTDLRKDNLDYIEYILNEAESLEGIVKSIVLKTEDIEDLDEDYKNTDTDPLK